MVRPRANYITNLSLSETSGGWSGFNAAMFATLSRHYSMEYVGPVSPPVDFVAKVRSKAMRLAGRAGSFQFFSERRLEETARIVAHRTDRGASLDFFHGSTPWIAFAPPVPYACYVDVCFATYVSVYHDRSHFDVGDIARIEVAEADWLRRAERVFFSSAWAMSEARRAYDLDERSLRVAGMGGHLPIPERDVYVGGHDFLFIALDFEGKGGRVCVDAFRTTRREIPDARLRIVGENPPSYALETPGVVYEGRLSKSNPVERQRLLYLLATAFALVHPTVKDATPQVIIEAAYHGCPAIAPMSFGIPEMVLDGSTGWLVAAPPTAADVAERMIWMCRNTEAYRKMREAARAHALEDFTWERVGDRVSAELTRALA